MKKLNHDSIANINGGICQVLITPAGVAMPICFPAPCWTGTAFGLSDPFINPTETFCPA